MTQVVNLNWDVLKTACATRKGQCEAAIMRRRANALEGLPRDRLLDVGTRQIEDVSARLQTMIAECEAKLAMRRWEALVASRRATIAIAAGLEESASNARRWRLGTILVSRAEA